MTSRRYLELAGFSQEEIEKILDYLKDNIVPGGVNALISALRGNQIPRIFLDKNWFNGVNQAGKGKAARL